MGYDPGIATPFENAAAVDVDLSRYWHAVTCPTLLVRENTPTSCPERSLHRWFNADLSRGWSNFPALATHHADGRDQIRTVREFLLQAEQTIRLSVPQEAQCAAWRCHKLATTPRHPARTAIYSTENDERIFHLVTCTFFIRGNMREHQAPARGGRNIPSPARSSLLW